MRLDPVRQRLFDDPKGPCGLKNPQAGGDQPQRLPLELMCKPSAVLSPSSSSLRSVVVLLRGTFSGGKVIVRFIPFRGAQGLREAHVHKRQPHDLRCLEMRTVPQVSTGVSCVGYADFLRLTLPHTLRALGSATVLTTSTDVDTLRCAEEHAVPVHLTDAWYDSGASFDKAAGLNSWLDTLTSDSESWVLILDADILVPPQVLPDLETLDPQCLYGVPRRACLSQVEWNAFVGGEREWETFVVDRPSIRKGKLWGAHPTDNVAAVCGYFQLWHSIYAAGNKRFTPCPTAACYDVLFALSFQEDRRFELPGREVLHLGPTNTNWAGRISEAWNSSELLTRDFSLLRDRSLNGPL